MAERNSTNNGVRGEAFALRKLLSSIAGREITKEEENGFKQALADDVGVRARHIDCDFVRQLWLNEIKTDRIRMRQLLLESFLSAPDHPTQAQTRMKRRRSP